MLLWDDFIRKFEFPISEMTDDISKAVMDFKPHLIAGVNILIQGDYTHVTTGERVLRGQVCGRATLILGYFLQTQGLEVYRAHTDFFNEECFGKYSAPDGHMFSVAGGKIYDAAYRQFTDIFYLPEEDLPKDEILITDYSNLEDVISSFAGLKDRRIQTHPNPSEFADLKIFGLSFEELKQYYRRVWDYNTDNFELTPETVLRDRIAVYKRGGYVSLGSIELIKYMDSNGLIKDF